MGNKGWERKEKRKETRKDDTHNKSSNTDNDNEKKENRPAHINEHEKTTRKFSEIGLPGVESLTGHCRGILHATTAPLSPPTQLPNSAKFMFVLIVDISP